MTRLIAPALLAALIATPALAQPAPHRTGRATAHPHRVVRPARPTATDGSPLDRGPFTPEANRAYQGGGVVLQGQPGGPAPMPQPTPPGQMPANAVPPR